MGETDSDVGRLNAALAAMAERAAADPAYREELKINQVEALQNAGVSALALAGVFAESGAEEAEVAAFGMGIGMPGPSTGGTAGASGGSGIIINGICIGTCKRATITIDTGCTHSFL